MGKRVALGVVAVVILAGAAYAEVNTSWGGAVRCDSSSPLIQDCIFSNCRAERGGGLYCYNSSPDLSNCLLVDNTANSHGGGIYISGEPSPDLTHCTIVFNTAYEYGSGIGCPNNSSMARAFFRLIASPVRITAPESTSRRRRPAA